MSRSRISALSSMTRTRTAFAGVIIYCLPLCPITNVGAATAARFLHEIELGDFHAAFEGLAHIVDGQRSDCCACECFHFDTRWAGGRSFRGNLDSILAQLGVHIYVRQGEGVTKRNQLRSAFGGGDSGNSRDFEGIALG